MSATTMLRQGTARLVREFSAKSIKNVDKSAPYTSSVWVRSTSSSTAVADTGEQQQHQQEQSPVASAPEAEGKRSVPEPAFALEDGFAGGWKSDPYDKGADTGKQQQVQQPERRHHTPALESESKKPAPELVMEDGFAGGWKPELEPKAVHPTFPYKPAEAQPPEEGPRPVPSLPVKRPR